MLILLARIYGFFVHRRNKRFDAHTVPIVQVDKPVISVGNITTGGTGKTPVVQWLVRHLQDLGRQPAIVMRGYKRASRGLLVVHDGEDIVTDVHKAGDEAFLHASKLNVPVVVCSSKVDAAVHAAGFLPCDVIVVDDGFQHRSLHRDIDVVVTAETPAAKLQLLPKGVLREPVENLHRADVVLRIAIEADRVYALGKDGVQGASEGSAFGLKRVLPVTGIANPERFLTTLAGITSTTVLEPMTFADHRWYRKSDVSAMITNALQYDACIATTEKDVVKLEAFTEQFAEANVEVFVVSTRIEILEGEEQLKALILTKVINEDSSVESIG